MIDQTLDHADNSVRLVLLFASTLKKQFAVFMLYFTRIDFVWQYQYPLQAVTQVTAKNRR